MKLYHGTSGHRFLQMAFQGAMIHPRRHTQHDNWKHTIKSHPNVVYLTDCYAGYFAINAIDFDRDPEPHKAAIIEIDTDAIAANLVPDEDCLEQMDRKGAKVSKSKMYKRTAEFRRWLHTFKGSDLWERSVANMGTCGHFGPLSIEGARVALVNIREHPKWTWASYDPTITVQNYRICGQRYRDLTAQAFEIGEVIQL